MDWKLRAGWEFGSLGEPAELSAAPLSAMLLWYSPQSIRIEVDQWLHSGHRGDKSHGLQPCHAPQAAATYAAKAFLYLSPAGRSR